MSYYITIHNGSVHENPENLWVNIAFSFKEQFYLRTDGALITYMIERIRERKFTISKEPWDQRRRWVISLPVSKEQESVDTAAADAQQLTEWYRVQVLNGNATINRELLFDRRPFHVGGVFTLDHVLLWADSFSIYKGMRSIEVGTGGICLHRRRLSPKTWINAALTCKWKQ